MKFFAWLLFLELVVVAIVPIIFVNIESRLVAGMIAGTIFIALGLFVFVKGLRERAFRKTFSFAAGCLHLFLSAFPLFITRLMNYSKGFEDVRVMGLPGPVFHQVSTAIFSLLLLATVIDLVLTWRRLRAGRTN